ncbi:PorT family protein [Rasiella rasia]|uniref:PorT family protein n=1 Tax=Rasiella rasia TaxID=2744027 RepID=A0A6G6GPI4_9FLAO|nr:PorT family protein [Rasiella rasia]QIE60380.1 PorT family protein [Rasiella rasia]
MKIVTISIAVVLWALACSFSIAQEALTKLEILEKSRTEVVNQEKEALKEEVENINKQVEKGIITVEEAANKKQLAAEKRALNIENKVAIIDNKIELVKRNGTANEKGKNIFSIQFGDNEDDESTGEWGLYFSDKPEHKRKYDRRTSSQLVFSFGLNNAIIDGQSLSDSPYKIGGSRYAELGLAWTTRVFKESNFLRFRYGVSFQFNGLKATDNRYFVDTGAQTELQDFGLDLDKSKFRMDNVVVPVHFEIGGSRKIEKEDYFRYNTNKSFKLGVGGYAGLNMSARQKLKFDNGDEKVKQKLKAGYNTNNFIYGLSAYVGYGDISLYAKYDLNTIFKDNTIDQRNVSLGVRWDWD